ncbi:MAG: InlB B-repeat-containing protein, partial [Candidatus Natronoplasma sp.]
RFEIQGEGTVVVNGDEVNDRWDETFEEGTEVDLSASPDEGWEFIEWKGDYESTEKQVNITMEEDMDITAVFEEEESAPLAIAIEVEHEQDEERIKVTFVAMSTPSSADIEKINVRVYDGASDEESPVDDDYISDPDNWMMLNEDEEAIDGAMLTIEEEGFEGNFPSEPESLKVTIDGYDGSVEAGF